MIRGLLDHHICTFMQYTRMGLHKRVSESHTRSIGGTAKVLGVPMRDIHAHILALGN